MAMQSTSKAVALSRDLHDRLAIRSKSSAGLSNVREAMDAQGWPMLFLSVGGSESAGQPVIGIRIKNIDVGAVDNFGNATLPFAPHQCEIACEANVAGAPLVPSAISFSFVVSSANATIGATYTNNGATFVVQNTISGLTVLSGISSNGAPLSSGTLTKTSGTGDSTITFSANTLVRSYAMDWATVMVECAKMGTIIIEESIPAGTAVSEASMNAATQVVSIKDIDWSNHGNV